jgi:predicted ATPase/DNA-binding XRE family transcriptional regulator
MATDITFGEALRHHRRAAELTQEALAERAGLSARSISAFERSEGFTPRRDTLALLVRALNLSATDRNNFESLVSRKPRGANSEPLPKARSASTLPRSLTSFVGRERELAQLSKLIPLVPLLTIIGTGGMGKTRLALEVARALENTFADGVRLVRLDALTAGARAREALLDSAPGDGHVLLVVDNCEHLVAACAETIRDLLATCPRLHILATSREPLRIAGETQWVLAPLPGPDPDGAYIDSPAVQLFVDRVRAISPEFALTDDNAEAVGRVCEAVDGIPLALELAAGRTPMLTVEQLADLLAQDLDLLVAHGRDTVARHRTLSAAIDWTYASLSDAERTLLRRLAPFTCPWTLELAEMICTGYPLTRGDVFELLGQLVEKSLVSVDTRTATAQYRLFEPIRKYALARLDASADAIVYYARHEALAPAQRFTQTAGPLSRVNRSSHVVAPLRDCSRPRHHAVLPIRSVAGARNSG